MKEFYVGKISSVDDNLKASINIFDNAEPFKDCVFIGNHTSEVNVGDTALVLIISKELFLYTILTLDSFLGIKNGDSYIDIGSSSNDTIIINAPNVIINSDDIKIGSESSSYTPLTLEDIPSITYIPYPSGSPGPPVSVTFTGTPNVTKTKIE